MPIKVKGKIGKQQLKKKKKKKKKKGGKKKIPPPLNTYLVNISAT